MKSPVAAFLLALFLGPLGLLYVGAQWSALELLAIAAVQVFARQSDESATIALACVWLAAAFAAAAEAKRINVIGAALGVPAAQAVAAVAKPAQATPRPAAAAALANEDPFPCPACGRTITTRFCQFCRWTEAAV